MAEAGAGAGVVGVMTAFIVAGAIMLKSDPDAQDQQGYETTFEQSQSDDIVFEAEEDGIKIKKHASGIVDVEIDGSRWGDAAGSLADLGKGPYIFNPSDAKAERDALLSAASKAGFQCPPNYDRDEVPPAMFVRKGGRVCCVEQSENRGFGRHLRSMLDKCGVKPNSKIRLFITNIVSEPDYDMCMSFKRQDDGSYELDEPRNM